jgi:intracellular septation protein
MKQFLEFIPITAFVVVYFLQDIYWATGALMLTISVQLALMWVLRSPISGPLKLTFWLSLVFGALTLFYRSADFIMWKPTIVNWLMAAALLGTLAVSRINLLERLLGTQLELPERVWLHLAFGWSAGFVLAGALNLLVAYNFSEAFWVSYRLWGGFALTLGYIALTMTYLVLGGHLQEAPEAAGPGAGTATNPQERGHQDS